jgi:hypothetical protein
MRRQTAHGRSGEEALGAFERIGARFEWASTALLLDDVALQGRAVLTELGCSPDCSS